MLNKYLNMDWTFLRLNASISSKWSKEKFIQVI